MTIGLYYRLGRAERKTHNEAKNNTKLTRPSKAKRHKIAQKIKNKAMYCLKYGNTSKYPFNKPIVNK